MWRPHFQLCHVSLSMTGYPAARRCHSCVQVKDGKMHLTQHIWTQLSETLVFNDISVSSPQRCLYVGVTTASWSCLTCGRSTCRLFSGPSSLPSCQSQPTFTVPQLPQLVVWVKLQRLIDKFWAQLTNSEPNCNLLLTRGVCELSIMVKECTCKDIRCLRGHFPWL